MAHLFTWDMEGRLCETRVTGDRPVPLAPPEPGAAAPRRGGHAASAWLLRTSDGLWLLVAAEGARAAVNGLPVPAGLRVLEHRDEVRVDARRWVLSTEEVAEIEPCPETPHALRCPRCTRSIEVGSPAVRCPSAGCGRWHHESEAFACWSSVPFCAVCSGSTAMDPERRWTPEEA